MSSTRGSTIGGNREPHQHDLAAKAFTASSARSGSTEPADTTIVWFDAEELAPVARGLVERLGAGEARLSDGRVAGTPITIVLGPDAVGTAPSTEPRDDGEMTHSPTPDAP